MLVGKIVGAHGIKGGLKVCPLTDFPEQRFIKGKLLYSENYEELLIEDARHANKLYVINLRNITDRNSAESLKNHCLYAKTSDKLIVPEDTYLVEEVIGCTVLDEDGSLVGRIQEIIHGKANDVYVIGQAEVQGRILMVPAVKEALIRIDVGHKVIKVKKNYLYDST